MNLIKLLIFIERTNFLQDLKKSFFTEGKTFYTKKFLNTIFFTK